MKRKAIILAALLAVLPAFGMFSGFVTVRPENTPETTVIMSKANITSLEQIAVRTADGTDYAGVQTPDGKKLLYNPADGGTYTADGSIAVDSATGTAVKYMADAQEFKNAKGETLTLFERSGGGAKVYDLGLGQYKVSAIKMEDKLYKLTIKANTAYNRGSAYEVLLKINTVVKKPEWWQGINAISTIHFEYYDMRGNSVSATYIDGAVSSMSFITGGVADLLSGAKQLNAAYFGTIRDVLQEIRIEFEQSEETEGFALNPETGEFLRTDLGDKILLGTNFQLIDVLGWPLIGADAWPLFWDVEQKIFKNYSGTVLTIDAQNRLVDTGGFIAHSVIQDILDGADLYCLYLADGKTYLPVTKEPNAEDCYDLNGKKIPASALIMPIFAEDTPPESSFWDFLFGDGSGGCGGGLSWLWTALIVIGIVIGFVLVIKFFKWVFGK